MPAGLSGIIWRDKPWAKGDVKMLITPDGWESRRNGGNEEGVCDVCDQLVVLSLWDGDSLNWLPTDEGHSLFEKFLLSVKFCTMETQSLDFTPLHLLLEPQDDDDSDDRNADEDLE